MMEYLNWSWVLGIFGTASQLLMVLPLLSAIVICMLTINQPKNPHDNHWGEYKQWSVQLKSIGVCVVCFFSGIMWLSIG